MVIRVLWPVLHTGRSFTLDPVSSLEIACMSHEPLVSKTGLGLTPNFIFLWSFRQEFGLHLVTYFLFGKCLVDIYTVSDRVLSSGDVAVRKTSHHGLHGA